MKQAILDKLKNEDFNDGYYHIKEDIINYPDVWLYTIWSLRGPGKTYSFLRYVLAEEKFFIYMKRTNKDIDLLCKRGFKLNDFIMYVYMVRKTHYRTVFVSDIHLGHPKNQ